MEEFDLFDFLINEEDEVMLLLHEQPGEPGNATIELDREARVAVLHRSEEDIIELTDISEDVFDSLADADKLMVCELTKTEDDEDSEIVYAYEAEIRD